LAVRPRHTPLYGAKSNRNIGSRNVIVDGHIREGAGDREREDGEGEERSEGVAQPAAGTVGRRLAAAAAAGARGQAPANQQRNNSGKRGRLGKSGRAA
jgi:hypothetical protein